jgi:hypothetical protein
MSAGKIMRGNRHHRACRAEHDAVRFGSAFVLFPLDSKSGLVYMSVYPVAVFKVVGDETIDDLYTGEESEQIPIVFLSDGREIITCTVLTSVPAL